MSNKSDVEEIKCFIKSIRHCLELIEDVLSRLERRGDNNGG